MSAALAVIARYVQGSGIDEPLAQNRTGTSYYSADGLGSITSLTDGSGTQAATFVYGAFGVLNSSTGTVSNSYRYTSREFDEETGLYYYRARYYDLNNGRFISEDQNGFDSGPNPFVYGNNDPSTYTDPLGLAPIRPSRLRADKNTALNMALDPKCRKFILDTLQHALERRRRRERARGIGFDRETLAAQNQAIDMGSFLNTMFSASVQISSGHPNWAAHAGEFTIWIDDGYDGPITWIHETFHLQPYAFSDVDLAETLAVPYVEDPRNNVTTAENASRAWDCELEKACNPKHK